MRRLCRLNILRTEAWGMAQAEGPAASRAKTSPGMAGVLPEATAPTDSCTSSGTEHCKSGFAPLELLTLSHSYCSRWFQMQPLLVYCICFTLTHKSPISKLMFQCIQFGKHSVDHSSHAAERRPIGTEWLWLHVERVIWQSNNTLIRSFVPHGFWHLNSIIHI